MNEVQMKCETTIGTIFISATSDYVTRIFWTKAPVSFVSLDSRTKEAILIKKAKKQIDEYLAGKRKEFDLPIFYEGTTFQKEVWRELCNIPYGKTINYSELAIKVKRPKAVRAVGSANGKNPLSIVVPCHRVIGKSGELSGYAGGVKIKEALLKLEGLK